MEWVAFPTQGDLLDPRIKPMSLVFPTLASRFFTTEPPGKPHTQDLGRTRGSTLRFSACKSNCSTERKKASVTQLEESYMSIE